MKHPLPNRSAASSGAYWTELKPDLWSARVHAAVAAVAVASGAILLSSVNVSVALRIVAILGWTLAGIQSAMRELHARRFVRCLRFAGDGSVGIGLRRGDWVAGSFRHGSLVLRWIAWIRLRLDDGGSADFLLLAVTQNSEDWRRFLVISRYVGRVS